MCCPSGFLPLFDHRGCLDLIIGVSYRFRLYGQREKCNYLLSDVSASRRRLPSGPFAFRFPVTPQGSHSPEVQPVQPSLGDEFPPRGPGERGLQGLETTGPRRRRGRGAGWVNGQAEVGVRGFKSEY